MDSTITGAARALAAGNPLGALNQVALRDDATALALRGIAMAQLGELVRAKALLRAAARRFGPNELVARARCIVAQADIALVARDVSWPAQALRVARAILEQHGDHANAAYARYLEVRRFLLTGRLEQAERTLTDLDPSALPGFFRALHEMLLAGIAIRRLRTRVARSALARAKRAALQADIPALIAEVQRASLALSTPAARLIASGKERPLRLAQVAALLESKLLLVDGCRPALRHANRAISLARRPVLFRLARALAEAWPEDVPRELLLARAFGAKQADESHRARLRVEIARLRAAIRLLARVTATKRGFALSPRSARKVVVLAPPVEGEHPTLLAFLADGEPWSSSALAALLDRSQRSVQRALDSLSAAGKVRSFGRGALGVG
jgi:hypothetical protein